MKNYMPIRNGRLGRMDRFLYKYNLPKLNQEEIENLNRPIRSMEIKTVINNLSTNKNLGLYGFTGEFYQKFREELTPTQTLSENRIGRQTSKFIL